MMTRAWLAVGVVAVLFGCSKSDKKDENEANPVRDHRKGGGDDAPKPPKTDGPAKTMTAVDVTFENGDRSIEGVLTRPVANGKYPAVLIHAGSGPTDRDWNNKMMTGTNGSGKLLAEELSRNGFVVLRFDKMGTGKTTAPDPLTWAAVLDDAHAGLELLRGNDVVNRDKIFLAGHSEGGVQMIGLAGREKDKIAGLVLLASAGRSMKDVIIGQLTGQFADAGMNADEEMKPIRAAMDKFFGGDAVDPTTASKHVGVQQLMASIFNPASAVYARELYGFDPATGVAALRVPIFVWNGDKDIQVSPDKDAKRLHDAAKKAGVESTLHLSPDADHVLKFEPTPKDEVGLAQAAQYNAADRTLDPNAVKAIVAWLKDHSK
jgi:hypothetical protein